VPPDAPAAPVVALGHCVALAQQNPPALDGGPEGVVQMPLEQSLFCSQRSP
jgi:hypothetical protein